MQYGSYQCLWLLKNFQEYSFRSSAVTYTVIVFNGQNTKRHLILNHVCKIFGCTLLCVTKLNSVALVRTRTIPTERPPPVGEVSTNFCG